MSDMEWTNDMVIRLITEYKKRPQLWDSSHGLYRTYTTKYMAWSELARLFQCDIAELRKKLNSILASHRREKTKVQCGIRTTWFLYPHMAFLPNHIDSNRTAAASESGRHVVTLPEEPEQLSAEENAGEDEIAAAEGRAVVVKTEPAVELPKVNKKREARRKASPAKLPKRRMVNEYDDEGDEENGSALSEAARLLSRSDPLKKKDECDSFGEYIADSLRKHDERTQAMIKQAINNILFEQEMKRCGGGPFAAR